MHFAIWKKSSKERTNTISQFHSHGFPESSNSDERERERAKRLWGNKKMWLLSTSSESLGVISHIFLPPDRLSCLLHCNDQRSYSLLFSSRKFTEKKGKESWRSARSMMMRPSCSRWACVAAAWKVSRMEIEFEIATFPPDQTEFSSISKHMSVQLKNSCKIYPISSHKISTHFNQKENCASKTFFSSPKSSKASEAPPIELHYTLPITTGVCRKNINWIACANEKREKRERRARDPFVCNTRDSRDRCLAVALIKLSILSSYCLKLIPIRLSHCYRWPLERKEMYVACCSVYVYWIFFGSPHNSLLLVSGLFTSGASHMHDFVCRREELSVSC